MVYSALMCYFNPSLTKLTENQYFNYFTFICSKMDYFKPYSGIYKMTQLTDTEKNAKKIFQGRTPPETRSPGTPSHPL